MNDMERWRLLVQGVVQGVGFRPFVYALASRHRLCGFVANRSDGVHIEVEGQPDALRQFHADLQSQLPPLAHIDSVLVQSVAPQGGSSFEIHESTAQTGPSTPVSPDVATCPDCLQELFDPADRRYLYPFINCTNCGPRFTIIRDIPYDRPLTTMASFPMCPACTAEYRDPLNRRYHAQPNACPVCGPHVWLHPGNQVGQAALEAVRQALAAGRIVAIKGIGGFHLACDATSSDAVSELRSRKGRGDKPFAVMARNLEQVRQFAEVSDEEAVLLTSRERPILLLRRKESASLSPFVAPGTALLGFLLPYSPLHHLLLGDRPLVMTSGNLSDEPICRVNEEAIQRLSPLADLFLLHNREIHVVCDDSVMRIHEGRELPLRRARGYAPLPVRLPRSAETVLAVGGELKSTFCLTKGRYAYLSPHIGDMENLETQQAFERSLSHLQSIFRCTPKRVICDLHPGYLSTRWATKFSEEHEIPLLQVQHHHAHVASLMAEHGLDGSQPVIGISFDGTGYGTDGAIWGGEILLADYSSFRRAAHLNYVPLPGGDAAVKRPYRIALAHLHAAGIRWLPELPCVAAASVRELTVLQRQMETGFNCVPTSSMGRLFDAVASLLGICHFASYEAQAAIELEMRAESQPVEGYQFALSGEGEIVMDSSPVLQSIVRELLGGIPPAVISARFHTAVADCAVSVCDRLRRETGIQRVALTGGVFQNVLLLQLTKARLLQAEFEVLTHRIVPPNDGGLALGQAVIGAKD
jgi:hydrogenase maturation protein HypF